MQRAATFLFASALAFAPPDFRREYGPAMRRDFRRALGEERVVHGNLGALLYTAGAVADVFTAGLREYASMLFRDFAYALRSLRKTPSFSAVVVVTLALAIGANAAVFSILNTAVLAPLPYAAPDRLVALEASIGGRPYHFSLPDYADVVRTSSGAFARSAAFASAAATMTGRGAPQKLVGIETTPGLFETLGKPPELGRFFDAADAARGAAKTVVLSDALWRTAFGADPQILGSTVLLDGDAYRIVGVTPPQFAQPRIGSGFTPAQYWTVLPPDGAGTDYAQRGYHTFNVVARLAPPATFASARANVARALGLLKARYPADDATTEIVLEPLTDALVGSARPLLFALFAAVAAVLLVSCANVANLLLSRAAAREREFSVRVALGASRGRIVAQLLVESFTLALAGGAIGVGLALGVVRAFVALAPPNVPRAQSVTVDGAALLYTLGVVGFCTLAAGLAPAFATARREVATTLRTAGRGGDASRGARARSALVTAEIAMTLALVVATGLVVRSFVTLTTQPLGFDPSGIAVAGPIDLPDRRYGVDAYREAFMTRAVARVRAIPGVVAAQWAFGVPFTGYHWGTTFNIVGHASRPGFEPDADLSAVGSGFVALLHGTMLAGRTFTEDDRFGARPVVIVNATFARRYFPNRSALGARIVPGISEQGDKTDPARTIVGVVADLRSSLTKAPEPTIYLPIRQVPLSDAFLVLRTRGAAPLAAAAAEITNLDPLLATPAVEPLGSYVAESVATQRLSVAALSALAFVALALSIAGVFAVVSYGVTQRTHEFGVRMALGAQAQTIVRTVLGGALRLAAYGIVLGLLIAGAGTRLVADQLYETQPLDPLTFVIVTALVTFAALLAALIPARRATRVDPIVALRYE